MMNPTPTIEIVEEPAPNLLRFRYLSEQGSGSLLGVNSTGDKKTYPAIRIVNYNGIASIIVSCVTANEPYKSHPHQLVGRNCAKGICHIANIATNSESVIDFPKLRIQCVKMNEIQEKLEERCKDLMIDPFRQGFQHAQEIRRALNCVRLCFQVLIKPDPKNLSYKKLLQPKVTQPIYNMKTTAELKISEISDTSSSVCGGKKIMFFCNRIFREDIKVRFFQINEENEIREDWGTNLNIYRNFGITCMTPKYKHQDVDTAVNVSVQLVRPSDRMQSKPISFQYVPDVRNMDVMRKRKKCKIKESEQLFEYFIEMNSNTPSTSAHCQLQHNSLREYQPEQQLRVEQENLPELSDLPDLSDDIDFFLLGNNFTQEDILQQPQQG